jgi:hypothetical protein
MGGRDEVTREDDIEFCADCSHAADVHDRRAEDGSCSECARTDGPCKNKSMRKSLKRFSRTDSRNASGVSTRAPCIPISEPTTAPPADSVWA